MAGRVRGQGSVRFHDGRWQARVQIAPGRRPTASFPTEREAWDWIHGTIAIASGAVPPPAAPIETPPAAPIELGPRTFEDACNLYKLHRIPKWQDGVDGGSSREWDEAARPVLRAFGKRPLKSIIHGDLVSWMDSQIGRQILHKGKPTGRCLSPRTANKYVRVLKAVFKHAVKMGFLGADPAASLEHDTRKGVAKVRARTLRLWEVQALLARAPARHRLRITFLALSGLRRGEICRSEWSWLHLDGDRDCPHCALRDPHADPVDGPHIHVMRPKVRVPTPRILPLAPQLVALLQAVPEAKRWQYIFTWKTDGVRRPISSMCKSIKTACVAAGVDPTRVGHHSFRYAFGSILEVDLRAPRGVVRALERHAAAEMTDLYVEATFAQQREWLERLADLVYGPPVAVPMRRAR